MLNGFLEIPQVLPTSNSRYCKVFQFKYHVNFKARTGCCTPSPPELNIGIAIGNVGIANVPATAAAVTRSQPVLPTAPVQPSAPPLLDDLRECSCFEHRTQLQIFLQHPRLKKLPEINRQALITHNQWNLCYQTGRSFHGLHL